MPEPARQYATPPPGATVHILHPLATHALCGDRLNGGAFVRRAHADEATCDACLQELQHAEA